MLGVHLQFPFRFLFRGVQDFWSNWLHAHHLRNASSIIFLNFKIKWSNTYRVCVSSICRRRLEAQLRSLRTAGVHPHFSILSERANLKVQGDQTYSYFAHRAIEKEKKIRRPLHTFNASQKVAWKEKTPPLLKYIKNQWQPLFSIFERKKSSISLRRDNLSPNAGGSFRLGYNCGPGGCRYTGHGRDIIHNNKRGQKGHQQSRLLSLVLESEGFKLFRDKKRPRVAPFYSLQESRTLCSIRRDFPQRRPLLLGEYNFIQRGRKKKKSVKRKATPESAQFGEEPSAGFFLFFRFFCGRPHFLWRRRRETLFTTMNF